ncbi:MAG: hypothetical protein ACT4QB_05530 [Gammaproteobacteria bacterium]
MSCEPLERPSNVHELLVLLAEKDGEIARLTREAEHPPQPLQKSMASPGLLAGGMGNGLRRCASEIEPRARNTR